MPNGMGTFYIEPIEAAFRRHQIPAAIQPALYDKCVIMINTYHRVYAEEHPKDKK